MPEPNSTSAVLEPKEAETTSEKSPLSPEVSQSPKEGENPAEKLPEKETSSQEPPSPDADDKLPFNQHPRWKAIYGENKEMKETISELADIGIKSKEDAETLLE